MESNGSTTELSGIAANDGNVLPEYEPPFCRVDVHHLMDCFDAEPGSQGQELCDKIHDVIEEIYSDYSKLMTKQKNVVVQVRAEDDETALWEQLDYWSTYDRSLHLVKERIEELFKEKNALLVALAAFGHSRIHSHILIESRAVDAVREHINLMLAEYEKSRQEAHLIACERWHKAKINKYIRAGLYRLAHETFYEARDGSGVGMCLWELDWPVDAAGDYKQLSELDWEKKWVFPLLHSEQNSSL